MRQSKTEAILRLIQLWNKRLESHKQTVKRERTEKLQGQIHELIRCIKELDDLL